MANLKTQNVENGKDLQKKWKTLICDFATIPHETLIKPFTFYKKIQNLQMENGKILQKNVKP